MTFLGFLLATAFKHKGTLLMLIYFPRDVELLIGETWLEKECTATAQVHVRQSFMHLGTISLCAWLGQGLCSREGGTEYV